LIIDRRQSHQHETFSYLFDTSLSEKLLATKL
jgi:hypothetical protein